MNKILALLFIFSIFSFGEDLPPREVLQHQVELMEHWQDVSWFPADNMYYPYTKEYYFPQKLLDIVKKSTKAQIAINTESQRNDPGIANFDVYKQWQKAHREALNSQYEDMIYDMTQLANKTTDPLEKRFIELKTQQIKRLYVNGSVAFCYKQVWCHVKNLNDPRTPEEEIRFQEEKNKKK